MNAKLSERTTASQLLRLAANVLEEHPMPKSAVTVSADEVHVVVYDPGLTPELKVEAVNSLAQHLGIDQPGRTGPSGAVFTARGDRLGVAWVLQTVVLS